MFAIFNSIWQLSLFWSSTNEKLIEPNNLQLHSTTTSSKLEIQCIRAHPRGQTLRAGAALLIGQHSVSCPCLLQCWQIVAAASCLTIGNGPTEEVHVLLSFPACSVSEWTVVCGMCVCVVGCGSYSTSFPCLPLLPPTPPRGCQIGFVSSSRLWTWPSGHGHVSHHCRAACLGSVCACSQGRGLLLSPPEGSGWTTAMLRRKTSTLFYVHFLRRVLWEAACPRTLWVLSAFGIWN